MSSSHRTRFANDTTAVNATEPVTAAASVAARFDVSTNDVLAGSDVAIVSPPTKGTASCDLGGACTYRSTAAAGWDMFTYRLGDESGPRATVRLRLVPAAAGTVPGLDTPAAVASGQPFDASVTLRANGLIDDEGAHLTQRPLVATGEAGLTFGEDVTTAAGWASFVGDDGSIVLTPGPESLLGNSRTSLVPPPLPPISQGTGGDGHVPILVGTKVFAFFHHSSPTSVSCVDRRSGDLCPGYPKTVPISADDAPGPGVVHGSKIYVKLSNYGGVDFAPVGVFCWDAATDSTCGMFVVDRTERPTTTTYPVRVGDHAYFAAGTGLLYCLNLSTARPCDRATTRFAPADLQVFDIDTHGGRVYVAGSGGTSCLVAANGARCDGWSTARDLGDTNLVTMRDRAGVPIGICAANYKVQCVADNSTEIEDLGAWPAGTPPYTITGESTLGTRTFVGVYGNSGLGCYDWSARSLCDGDNFTGGAATLSSDGDRLPSAYGTASDGACIVGLGDPGQIFTMDARGNSPCTSVSRGGDGLSVDLRAQRCDGTTGSARWSSVDVDGARLGLDGDFTSFVVTVKDTESSEVVATGELVGAGSKLDLSAIDPKLHPDLSADISTQRSLTSTAWDDGIGPRVTLAWTADAQVGCLRATAEIACTAVPQTAVSVTDGVDPKLRNTIAVTVPGCSSISTPSTTSTSTTTSTTVASAVRDATEQRTPEPEVTTGSGIPLATTGMSIRRFLPLAMLAIGVGLLLVGVVLTRRRRSEQT